MKFLQGENIQITLLFCCAYIWKKGKQRFLETMMPMPTNWILSVSVASLLLLPYDIGVFVFVCWQNRCCVVYIFTDKQTLIIQWWQREIQSASYSFLRHMHVQCVWMAVWYACSSLLVWLEVTSETIQKICQEFVGFFKKNLVSINTWVCVAWILFAITHLCVRNCYKCLMCKSCWL